MMPALRKPTGHASVSPWLRFTTTSHAPMPANPRLDTSPAKKNPVVPQTIRPEPRTVTAAPDERSPDGGGHGSALDLSTQPPGQQAAQDAGRGVADVVDRPERPSYGEVGREADALPAAAPPIARASRPVSWCALRPSSISSAAWRIGQQYHLSASGSQ